MAIRQWQRLWSGRDSGATETFSWIAGDRNPGRDNTTSLGEGFEVRKPSTLILKNVDEDYDGNYRFGIITKHLDRIDSDVTVLVLSKYFYNCLLFTV